MLSSRLLYGAAAIVTIIAFIPTPQIVAPAWTVRTVSSAHSPLSGITVREDWQQYSLERSSHEEDRVTDLQGEVRFPRRTLRSSFTERLLGCLRQIGETGVHTSCGTSSHLVAFGPGVDTLAWQDSGQEQGTTLPWQTSTLISTH